MIARVLMRVFVAIAAIVAVASLAYVYVVPPASLRMSAEGVPYFSPPIAHPVTGEPLRLDELVRHYKAAKR
ncbi:MAG: hypothetical protein OHK0026_03450 [Rhodocyclaceae bacterium]